MNANPDSLSELGYDDRLESIRKESGFAAYPAARVIAQYRGAYRVKNTEGEFLAKITGKHMFTAEKREDYPAVGDWVVIQKLSENKALIRGILPRKTILRKQGGKGAGTQIIATNIDTAFIVESLDRDYNLNRFERYLVLVNEAGITPVFILNKTDLFTREELSSRIIEVRNRFPGADVIAASTVNLQGVANLSGMIGRGKTCCFLGSSGVGKSSLINAMLRKGEIKVGEINEAIERGRHTTTTREMYFLENGAMVIDNPGIRQVGIADSDSGMDAVFDDIGVRSKECKYANCTHVHEPGCAVLMAIEENRLDKAKYANFIKLRKEADFYKMTEVEKREKDRKFGKFIKKVKQSLEQ